MFKNLTPSFYSDIIKRHQDYFDSGDLYWFAAYPNDINGKSNINISQSLESEVYNKILYGGRLNKSNIAPLVREIKWANGEVYDKYDPHDITLENKNFFIINSKFAVYKCLNNNNNSPSLIEPNFTQSKQFTLADGYVWQYMYSLTSNLYNNYKFHGYIPILGNQVTNIIPGSVSSIDVIAGGHFYELNSGNILIKASTSKFRISDSASNIPKIFDNYSVYNISRGEVDIITEYDVNSGGKFITTQNPHPTWQGGDKYEIIPTLKFIGNGSIKPTLAARVNETNNIYKVDIITAGEGFTLAEIIVDNNINMQSAPSFKINLSPKLGHGFDISADLAADSYILYVNLDAYTIGNAFPINNIPINSVGIISGLKVPSNMGDAPFTGSSFNNTFKILITPTNGSYQVGDKLKLLGESQYLCEIIEVDPTYVIGIYYTDNYRLKITDILINDAGISGLVVGVSYQPQISLKNARIISIINTDSIIRNTFSNELILKRITIRNK